MKTLLIFLVAFCFGYTGLSQDVYFDWVKQLDRRSGSQEGYSVGVDENKNVYFVGGFANTIDLDPSAGVFNVTSNGLDHIFVVKLDPAGKFIWGKDIGGNRFSQCRYLKVEPDGDLYLSGNFSGTTDFDPGPGTYLRTAAYVTGSENLDIFTMKLDADGNFKWAKTAGGLNNDDGSCVTTDLNGNVYTTGSFLGPVDFDPRSSVFNLGSNGYTNTFITKFDQDGNFIWAKEFAGNYNNHGICIRTDIAGNIYLSGLFEGTVDFDPGPAVHPLVSAFYSRTPYLAKLDPDGGFIWAHADAGGAPFEVNTSQQVISCASQSSFASLLTMFDVDGYPLWIKQLGGRQPGWPFGSSPLALDAAGNIFITGQFNYTSDFDPGPDTYNMTALGGGYNCDAFICSLDANGNFVWAKQFGSYPEELPTTISLDTSGNIYTIGIYNSIVDFDPGPGAFNMSAYSGGGIYIHKMSHCKDVSYSSLDVTGSSDYTVNNHIYTKSGTYTQTMPNSLGCDSIISINLKLQNITKAISVTSCDDYTWNNEVFTSSGSYTRKFRSAAGCDSLVQLNLTIKNKSLSVFDITICEGSEYQGYTKSGTYIDRFTASSGCDSLRTLHLRVEEKKYSDIKAIICNGQSYLGYKSSGTYIDVLKTTQGCDSTRTLHLQVNPVYSFTVRKTICAGENYMGHGISGIYIDRMQTASGCDSIQTTELTVMEKPFPRIGNDTTICINDSLTLHSKNGEMYTWQDGSVNDHFAVKGPGLYTAVSTNTCGNGTASILVKETACSIYFPNAFSPNNDGKNDKFGISNGYNITDYHLIVYNRWGQIIFESTKPATLWDGTYKSQALSSNVFVWKCSFKEHNISKNMSGTVLLIK